MICNVQGCRAQLDMEKVATGDETIRTACQRGRVLHVNYQRRLSLPERMRLSAQFAWDGIWQPPYPPG